MSEYYYYHSLHHPTGKHFIKRVSVEDYPSMEKFVKMVMVWNSKNPKEWQYWCSVNAPYLNPRFYYDEVKTLNDDVCLVGAA